MPIKVSFLKERTVIPPSAHASLDEVWEDLPISTISTIGDLADYAPVYERTLPKRPVPGSQIKLLVSYPVPTKSGRKHKHLLYKPTFTVRYNDDLSRNRVEVDIPKIIESIHEV